MLSQQFNQLIYQYIGLLFLILFLMGQIIGWRLWLRRAGQKWSRRLVHAVFIIFNLGWAFTVSTLYFGDNLTDFTWTWIGRPSVSWQTVYLLGILPLGLAGSIAAGLIMKIKRLTAGKSAVPEAGGPDGREGVDQRRRDFFKNLGTVGCGVVLGTCSYGVVRQGRPPTVDRLTLKVSGLPAELDGFTIAHITDIHLGLWSSRGELDKVLAVAAAEKPDLVAFTGDLVDRSADFAKLYHGPLKRLAQVPHGVWGVLGNHDHYTNDPALVARILTDGGLRMMMDEQVHIPGLPLSLIGLDDQGVHHSWMGSGRPSLAHSDPDALNFDLVRGPAPRPGDFTILLNHRPEGFAQAARHGCRLYLAGHTHGGQYQFPGQDQANLAAAFYKYSSGLYHEHAAWINVSRGVAAVGVPFRLWAWPEVSLIKLTRG